MVNRFLSSIGILLDSLGAKPLETKNSRASMVGPGEVTRLIRIKALRRGAGKNGPLARNGYFRRHPHLLGEVQMSKEMPDHPQNAQVADAIAQDAARRPGPAAPAWSESRLKSALPFPWRTATRPKTEAAVIASPKRNGSGG
jgi:hypothetical protein